MTWLIDWWRRRRIARMKVLTVRGPLKDQRGNELKIGDQVFMRLTVDYIPAGYQFISGRVEGAPCGARLSVFASFVRRMIPVYEAPLTRLWLLAAGFKEEGDGFFRYVQEYTGLHVYFDRGQWRWRLEEHRDNLNWDDKYFTLPTAAMPQTTTAARRLIEAMGGAVE